MEGTFRIEREGAVELIVLNRPPVNALTVETHQALLAELDRVRTDNGVRALVLTSSSDRFFCTGTDIKLFGAILSGESAYSSAALGELAHRVADRIARFHIPVVAGLTGHTLGGGLELAMACDFRILSAAARIGLPEIHLGIFPGAGGSQRLTRLLGRAKALELMMLGTQLTADEALQLGLVTRVCDPADVRAETLKLAALLAVKAPNALRLIKRCVTAAWDGDMTSGLEMEKQAFEEVILTEDAREGLNAFQAKREPQFTGR